MSSMISIFPSSPCRHPNPIVNQRGSGLIVVMIALGIIAFVALGVMTTRSQTFREVQRINLHLSATNVKSNLMTYINNSSSWTNTKNDTSNSSMSCLRPTVSNCQKDPKPVDVIRDANNNVVFDSSNSASGFKPSGEPCMEFTATGNGNPNCPLRPVITWDPKCSGASCTPSIIEIVITFQVKDGSGVPVNGDLYKTVIQRAP